MLSAKPLYSEDGQITAAVTVFEEVTAHVNMQNSLMESEERLKMAQRIAHVGSWEYCVKEDRAIWSEELFHIFGLPPGKFGPNAQRICG